MKTTKLIAPLAMCLALIVLPLAQIALLGSIAEASTQSSITVGTGEARIGTHTSHVTDGSISGTVTDVADPSGLAGVCVEAFDASDTLSGTDTTAVDGTYSITGLVPGTFQVYFDPTCFGAVSSSDVPQWYLNQTISDDATPVDVNSGAITAGVDASLLANGSISGTVTDAANPGGLSNVCVSAVSSDGGSGNGTAVTSTGGTFTIAELAPDSYTVTFDPTCSGSHSSSDVAKSFASPVTVASGANTPNINAQLAAATTIAVSSSTNPAYTGAAVIYSATITTTDNGGTVAFSDNGQAISACSAQHISAHVATCSQSYANPGAQEITAAYSGDAGFGPSNSAQYDEVIQSLPAAGTTPLKTSIALTSNANPATFGNVIYSADVSPTDDGGTVSFFDASQPLGGCQNVGLVSGVATCTQFVPPPGIHPISASFSGSTGFAPSTSSLSETVLQKTATSIGSSYNPAGVDATIDFVATTTPNAVGGTTLFEINGTAIAGCASQPLTKSQATCQVKNLRPGSYVITASYSGNAVFEPSTSSALTEKVLRASQITVRSIGTEKKGKVIHLVAKVAARFGSGYVTFTDNGRSIKACAKIQLRFGVGICTVRNLSVGRHVVSVAFSGNTRFGPSYNGVLEVIKK